MKKKPEPEIRTRVIGAATATKEQELEVFRKLLAIGRRIRAEERAKQKREEEL